MNSKILLTGIPGTGKTTLGDYLQETSGYHHVDLEPSWHDKTFPQDEPSFQKMIDSLSGEKIIITWGFPVWLSSYIKYIESKGFRHIWLDGDREVALKMFMSRERNNSEMEKAFHDQIRQIDESKIIDQLKPVVYDPFGEDGIFKDIQKRAEDIENL